MATALSQIPTTDYRLGFQSQEEETAVERLPVQGEMPAWLTGSLMRVTPAKLEAGDKRVGHWFDGLACLNRFGFADGQVSYRSRFLDSGAYRAAQAGWERWYVTDAVVTHAYAAVIDQRFLSRHTLWHARGMARFVRKHPERLLAL